MLNDMLKDPETPRWRVWLAMLDDIGNLMAGGVRRGRGVGTGVIAGLISSLVFVGEEVYGHRWAESREFVGILLISTAEGLSLVLFGATIARFGDIQRRVMRSARAFGTAWIAG